MQWFAFEHYLSLLGVGHHIIQHDASIGWGVANGQVLPITIEFHETEDFFIGVLEVAYRWTILLSQGLGIVKFDSSVAEPHCQSIQITVDIQASDDVGECLNLFSSFLSCEFPLN